MKRVSTINISTSLESLRLGKLCWKGLPNITDRENIIQCIQLLLPPKFPIEDQIKKLTCPSGGKGCHLLEPLSKFLICEAVFECCWWQISMLPWEVLLFAKNQISDPFGIPSYVWESIERIMVSSYLWWKSVFILWVRKPSSKAYRWLGQQNEEHGTR